MNAMPTGARPSWHPRIIYILIVSLALIAGFMWATGPVLNQQAQAMIPPPPSPSSVAAPHTTPTATFTPTPTTVLQANSCWPYRLYIPKFHAPYSATPTPAPTGDLDWSQYIRVVVAQTTPAVPIAGALVEARDLTYDCCVTGKYGWCYVQIRAHDTHYVGIKASAKGYRPTSVGVPAIPIGISLTLSLEPEK